MYDPRIGRWLEEDPIEFEGHDTNLYRYVGNEPTCFTDPSGLQKPDYVIPPGPLFPHGYYLGSPFYSKPSPDPQGGSWALPYMLTPPPQVVPLRKNTLEIKPVSEDPGFFGAFIIKTRWHLMNKSALGGFIIQKVDFKYKLWAYKGDDCIEIPAKQIPQFAAFPNNPELKPKPSAYPYWEAWRVNLGKQDTIYTDPDGSIKKDFDDQLSSPQFRPGTKGEITCTLEARYYDGLAVSSLSSFGVLNEPPYGTLPIALLDPSEDLTGSNVVPSNVVKRTIKITWDAKKEMGKTHIE
jgi:hypothetical protein